MKYFRLSKHSSQLKILVAVLLCGVFLLLIYQTHSNPGNPAYENSDYHKCLTRLSAHACNAFQQMGHVNYSLANKIDQTFWKSYSLYRVPYAIWHTFPNYAISDTGAVVQVAYTSDSDFDAHPDCIVNFNAISKREGVRITETNVLDYMGFYLKATIPSMQLDKLAPPISKAMVRRSGDAFPFTFLYDGLRAQYKSGSKQSLEITVHGDGRVVSSNMYGFRDGHCFSSDRMLNQHPTSP